MKEKWHCSYRRSLERRKNDIVNIDGAKSERNGIVHTDGA